MTQTEQKPIDSMNDMLKQIRAENNIFKDVLLKRVEKTEQMIKPINLEQEVLKSIQIAIGSAIEKGLTGYDSPLVKLVTSVVNSNSDQLKQIIADSFNQVISKDEFKLSIINAFSHKIARNIIATNDSLFDKIANDLKQDAVFKSKMSLAVALVVEDCIRHKV
jgi:hypothetical protein